MIEDWGYDYIYLQQQRAITQENLKNHSYKHAAMKLINDFELATLEAEKGASWHHSSTQLWMFGASACGSLLKDIVKLNNIWVKVHTTHNGSLSKYFSRLNG